MNNKGFVGILLIPLIIFIVIVSVIAGVVILKEFMAQAQISMPEAYNLSNTNVNNMITVMDYFVPIIFIGTGIAFVIMCFTIQTHPIFYIFGIFLILVGVMTTAVYSNAVEELNLTTGVYTGVALPVTLAMAQYMPHILFGIAVISAIIFYGRYGGGSVGV